MLRELARQARLQTIEWPAWQREGVEVQLWRLDELDAAASGNKLFKLAENLQAARAEGQKRLLSFGGVFSNHLHALALHGAAHGFETIGVIRGEPEAAQNPTLSEAAAAGMRLHFVDRDTYRNVRSVGPRRDALLAELQLRFGESYVIPEGASNHLGVCGCRALGEAIGAMTPMPDTVVLPCGTGATLAGVVAGLNDRSRVLGIAVLKGGEFLVDDVRDYLHQQTADHCVQWAIDLDHHGGGYARTTIEIEQFIAQFEHETGVALDPVYTGKMLYAIDRRIERGEFARGSRVLAVHTGGLQGARGFTYRCRIKQQAALNAG